MKRLALLATLVLAAPAQAADLWATAGPWSINRTTNACVAVARAGKGIVGVVRRLDGTSLLEYSGAAAGQGFTGDIVLRRGGERLVRLPLAPDPIDEELAVRFGPEEAAAAARTDAFSIIDARRKTVDQGELLAFSDMQEQVARCAREYAAIDRGSGRPAATPPALISLGMTADDYPSAALRSEAQGRTIANITVSAKGRVSECRTGVSSGFPILDEAACAVISRRARYRPARDASGEPTESKFKQPINWQIPQ